MRHGQRAGLRARFAARHCQVARAFLTSRASRFAFPCRRQNATLRCRQNIIVPACTLSDILHRTQTYILSTCTWKLRTVLPLKLMCLSAVVWRQRALENLQADSPAALSLSNGHSLEWHSQASPPLVFLPMHLSVFPTILHHSSPLARLRYCGD